MKNVFALLGIFLMVGSFYAFQPAATTNDTVKWYTWEEAIAANEKSPKKFYIDVYTNWCGWCKVMDKKTFTDPAVAAYLNQHFYPIKLNAEQREAIQFNGHTFKWQNAGRNGIHELAYSLLEGKMSYPSFVFLNEQYERIMVSPGYKKPEQLLPELKFAAEEHYKTTPWQDYMQQVNDGD